MIKKKYVSLAVCLTAVLLSVLGCGGKESKKNNTGIIPLPAATANPNITHPEGSFYVSSGEKKAEGGLVTLGDDFLNIMVEGEKVEFALSPKVQHELSVYNKDKKNPTVRQGTMLIITYTERDLIKIAESIDILEAN